MPALKKQLWIGTGLVAIIACIGLLTFQSSKPRTTADPESQAILEPAFTSQDIRSPFIVSRVENFWSKGWRVEFKPSEAAKKNHGRKDVLLLPLAVAGYQAAKSAPDISFVEIQTLNGNDDVVRAKAQLDDIREFLEQQDLNAFADSVDFEVTAWKPGAFAKHDRAIEYLERGRMFANEKGQIKEALPYFEEALKLDPGNVDVLYAIGVSHWALGNNSRAIEILEAARKANPEQYRIDTALARCYLQEKRRTDALDALARFDVTRSTRKPAADDRYYAPALYQAIFAYQQLGDTARARDLLKEFITRFPNDPTGYVLLGKLLYETKERKQAAMVFRKALDLKPADSVTCFELGWYLSQLKDYNSAVDALRRSYTLGCRDVNLFSSLSHSYAQLGRLFDAKHAAIEGMKVRSGDPQLEANFKAIHKAIVSRRLKPKSAPTPIELTES